jgi:hypothetical protein
VECAATKISDRLILALRRQSIEIVTPPRIDKHSRRPTRAAGRLDAKAAAGDLAAEGEPLQVEKSPCPLEIRQRVAIARGHALEFRTRRDLLFQRLHELRIMPPQDADQRRNI